MHFFFYPVIYTGTSKMQLFAVILLGLACFMGLASANNYSDCSTSYSTLERALLDSKNNTYNLWIAFYPPRSAVALFVDVEYKFQNEGGIVGDTIASRHFFWSSATFYFIQPPRVFGFTSLFFAFIPRERVQNLTLILPYDCKGIKPSSKNDYEENLLEVLTQRVNYL